TKNPPHRGGVEKNLPTQKGFLPGCSRCAPPRPGRHTPTMPPLHPPPCSRRLRRPLSGGWGGGRTPDPNNCFDLFWAKFHVLNLSPPRAIVPLTVCDPTPSGTRYDEHVATSGEMARRKALPGPADHRALPPPPHLPGALRRGGSVLLNKPPAEV